MNVFKKIERKVTNGWIENFIRKLEYIKNNQTDVLELTKTLSENKNLMEKYNRLNIVEHKVGELKKTQDKAEKEKKRKNQVMCKDIWDKLNNVNICKTEVPKVEDRINGGDTLFEELRPGVFQKFKKDNHTQNQETYQNPGSINKIKTLINVSW